MSTTFRQYDSRWGRKSYPSNSGDTMAGAGCGPTACASLIVNHPKHKAVTPINTRKFMVNNGYAIAGQGTAWSGIDACLKHFGMKVKTFDSMELFFEEMAKSGRKCIILFRGGSRGGVTWTTSGHFVAASAYKKGNGKHYLYTRDPGSRRNDGWHCYEDHMKGLIAKLWVCYVPTSEKEEPIKKAYSGTFPALPKKGYFVKGDKGKNVEYLQKLLNWIMNSKLEVDGRVGVNTSNIIKAYQEKYNLVVDGQFGKESLAKAKTIKK